MLKGVSKFNLWFPFVVPMLVTNEFSLLSGHISLDHFLLTTRVLAIYYLGSLGVPVLTYLDTW